MQISMQTKEEQNSHTIRLDKYFSWDFNKQLLIKDNQSIDLTKHEMVILEFLINKRGSVCSNDDIVYAFYLYEYDVIEKNIRNYIFKLRQKLSSTIIESIYGRGYRLNIDSNII